MEPVTKPAHGRRIAIGGLMRCCIQTIRTSEKETEIGEVMTCRYCRASFKVDPSGAWHWAPDYEPP